MSFGIGQNVGDNKIDKKDFQAQLGEKNLKKLQKNGALDTIWNKFDVNNDGSLDQGEQVAFWAYLKETAGDDDKISKKEAKEKAIGSTKYKDLKRIANAFDAKTAKGTAVKIQSNESYKVGENTTYSVEDNHIEQKTDESGTTKFEYDESGKIKKSTTTSTDNSKTTTKTYGQSDKVRFVAQEKIEDSTGTTTIKNAYIGGQEVPTGKTVVSKDGNTTTKYSYENNTFKFDESTVKDGNKTTTTKVNGNKTTVTINNGDTKTNTVTTYNKASTDGTIPTDATKEKEVVTDNNKNTETTTEGNKITKKSLDTNGKTVVIENGKAKIGDIELDASEDGQYILANTKFNGKGMEAAADVAIRLGFEKDSDEYNEILTANADRKQGEAVKIPSDLATKSKFKAEDAKVNKEAEDKKYQAYKKAEAAKVAAQRRQAYIAGNEKNMKTNANTAFAKYNKSNPNTKLRTTWATNSLGVYCDAKKDANGNQQHYIYSSATNGLVKIEKYLGIKDGTVKRITEDGYALLTNGKKIKINRQGIAAENISTANYNKSFKASHNSNAGSGTVKGTKIQQKSTDKPVDIANAIEHKLSENHGGTSAQKVLGVVEHYVTSNNVIEVYDAYKQEYGESFIRGVTHEWLGYGKGHGRDNARLVTANVLEKLIKRAESLGIKEGNSAYNVATSAYKELKESNRANNWVNGDLQTVNRSASIGFQSNYDSALAEYDIVMESLIKEIKKAETAKKSEETQKKEQKPEPKANARVGDGGGGGGAGAW